MLKILKSLIILFFLYCPLFVNSGNEKILRIFTTESFSEHWGAGKEIKALFEKKYNCEVKFTVFDHTNSLLSRLQYENSTTSADLVLGLDLNQINYLKKLDLFDLHNISLNKLDLPIPWRDLSFLPYCYGYLALLYHADDLNIKLPKNFDELINLQHKLKILMPDPRSSSLGFDFLIWTNEIFQSHFEEKWKKLIKKIPFITKSWAEGWNMFIAKEADIILSYDTSAGKHKIKNKEYLIKILEIEEEKMVQFQVAAKLKNSKEQELADQFLNFLIAPETQFLISKYNYMHPVIKSDKSLFYNKIVNNKIISIFKESNVNQQDLIKKWIDSIL